MDDDEQHLGMRMELALDKAKRRLEPEKLFDCEIIAVVSRFLRSAKRTFHDGSVGKGVNGDKRDSRYEMQDARCQIGGVAVNSLDEHVPEKPEGNDQGNDVFPPDAGQDSAPCARRTFRRISRESRPPENCGRRLHKFSSGKLRRPDSTSPERRNRRGNS